MHISPINITTPHFKGDNKHILFDDLKYEKYTKDIFDDTVCYDKKLPLDSCEIKMNFYPKDISWQNQTNKLILQISKLISKGESIDDILNISEFAIHKMYKGMNNFAYRTDSHAHCFAFDKNDRGGEYFKRYWDKIRKLFSFKAKANDEFKQAQRCDITSLYANINAPINKVKVHIYRQDNTNYDLVKQEYDKLRSNKKPNEKDVNSTCAKIAWLISQGFPYVRGNNSIATVLIRALQYSNNIEISPLKKGKSLDFEAFDTDLDTYIKNYPNFFEKTPKRIES